MGDTIFIAGAYGTGKSTLCKKLSVDMKIPSFSSGDLISEINGEQYGANKAVIDKNYNQTVLIQKIQELNLKHKQIILAGHFCIFSKDNDVESIPEYVFSDLNLSQIVLLEASEDIIYENLKKRDNKLYPHQSINQLVLIERKQSLKIAKELGVPILIYQMTFSDVDIKNVINFFEQRSSL